MHAKEYLLLENAAQHSVHPTGGSQRVFKQFVWLEVSSVKAALSRPAHQWVTQAVGRLYNKLMMLKIVLIEATKILSLMNIYILFRKVC